MSARTEKLRKKLSDGQFVSWIWIDLASSMSAEIIAGTGFDWIVVDAEHAPFNPESLLHILMAFNASDTVPLIRVPWNDHVMIKQALDMGYEGVIIPQVNRAEEAQMAVSACRYPPVGKRGFGPMRPAGYWRDGGKYAKQANDSIICAVQIEDINAVDEIDDIVETPGLDWILIGRYDMAGSMRLSDNLCNDVDNPQLWKGIKKILRTAEKAGIPCGCPLGGPDAIKRTVDAGGQLICLGRDTTYLQGAADNALKVFNDKLGNKSFK